MTRHARTTVVAALLFAASIAASIAPAIADKNWRGQSAVSSRSFERQASVARPPTAVSTTLTFDATCTPGRRAVIAAVGDLLFHDALQAQALRPGGSFRAFWAPVAKVLADADLTYGNLESPIAQGVRIGGHAHKDPGRVLDGIVYGRRDATSLIFNTHPSVAADLAETGFDIVSTANNHTADRGVLGMDRTLDALDAAGLAHTGVRRSTADTSTRFATRTTTRNGITVGWIACTYGLNGFPDPKNQVLHCHRDQEQLTDEVTSLAEDPTVDAVIVTPHWGIEGAPQPQANDRRLARTLIDAGATAIIGTHPHVLQPWEKQLARDGREGLIIYSTGNFISNQQSDDQRTGMIALLELTKPASGAPARLSAAGFIPTYVEMGNGHRVTELKGTQASLQRLPSGNRVTLATYRDLPRACAPPSPDRAQELVASASRPQRDPPIIAQRHPKLAMSIPDRRMMSVLSSKPTSQRRSSVAVPQQEPARNETAALPPIPAAAFNPVLDATALTARMQDRWPTPQRERKPQKQDPLRTGRLRLDQLALLAAPDVVPTSSPLVR